MTITIGFITSTPIEKHFKKIESELTPFCQIIYLNIDNEVGIVEQYNAYEASVDAFIFSGRLVYYSLLEKIASPNRPCYYFDESQVDIHRIFLELLLDNRQFDFSRLYIDVAAKGNDYLGIKGILGNETLPYFTEYDYEDATSLAQKVMNRHISLFNEGKIDLSITRMGSHLDAFKSHGIPYIYTYPSPDYMLNFTMKIINKIAMEKMTDRILGAIVLPQSHPRKSFPSFFYHKHLKA